ncbi:MAG: aminomethyl-transferring glycine dehydrogenase subunit GcvPA [Lachnospiraceae bacterium]|nr:aminomethyl-transferring glycine dehydrogenase subunit GcvPA [Lachnospiraceae bacterium]
MGNYIPGTADEQLAMLKAAGYQSFDELYRDVPESVRLQELPEFPKGKSEMEVRKELEALAGKNRVFKTVLRGAGSYRHYIPAIVTEVTGKEEFRTAYTPYQAEISQGVLQSIFEYQTDIAELTGMDAANASVYDGATAAAEAAEMCREKGRTKILVSSTVDPKILSVVKTYAFGRGTEVALIPEKDGATDPAALKTMLDATTAGVLLQQPNYYGVIEELEGIIADVHEAKAKVILSCNPVSLAVLKTPGEYGADIAVGEGQPLGLPMAFGGPYVGFMATTMKLIRRLPGRIVGETKDVDGKRGFVLTLQAREQHIRREKAGSNICSNEALCAMTVAVYLAAMGPEGLKDVARQCAAKAHYLAAELEKAGLKRSFDREFFHEFVTDAGSEERAAAILKALEAKDVLGGLPLGDGKILWCATEVVSKKELDLTAETVREVIA